MFITFDVKNFRPNDLISTLYYLKKSGSGFDHHNPDIEEITCRTPSSAYKYTRFVATTGISKKAERIFLRNPNIAVRYLTRINKREFSDPDTQKRFWKKILKKPDLAYSWCSAFKTRLSETEEEIFLGDVKRARDYAMFVICGRFPEKIHNMLVLKSFEDMDRWKKNWLQEYIRYAESKK
jgi:hypothetical protein